MARHVVLLRGINLAKRNRISMPELRTALAAEGYGDVQTYVQSGNVVLSSGALSERVARDVNALINSRFGLDVAVLVRSHAELDAIVKGDPLAQVATNPRRYLVTFLSGELPVGLVEDLRSLANQEPFAVVGREVYSWHPDGIARTPLWERLASKGLGIAATSRNWSTVTALLAMAGKPVDR